MTFASLFPLNLLSPSGEGNVACVLPTLTLGRIQTVTKTMGRMQVVYQDGGEDVDSVPGPWGGCRLCTRSMGRMQAVYQDCGEDVSPPHTIGWALRKGKQD